MTVKDEAAFSKASTFGTALVTLDKWKKVGASSLMIYDSDDALLVDIETNGAEFEIKAETIDEDVTAPKKPIRLGINLSKPAVAATISLKIAPMEKAKAASER